MLRLAEQIDRRHLGVASLVGDDQRLGRTGEEVDPDATEELALRLRDVCVARPHDHVDRCQVLGAERHRGHRLHTAERVDLVRSTEVHGRDDGRVRLAVERWGAGHDAPHARRLGGDDAHVRRCDHGVPATGHVAPDTVHRQVLVAQHHSRQRLDLHVAEGLALVQREAANLGLGELDVGDRLGGSDTTAASISASLSRNDAGAHRSNRSEHSRTAVSPRSATSARIASTVSRTCAPAARLSSALRPAFSLRIIA